MTILKFVSYEVEDAAGCILCSSPFTSRVVLECIPREVEGALLYISAPPLVASELNSKVFPVMMEMLVSM